MMENPGIHLREAQGAVNNGTHKNVKLMKSEKCDVPINFGQFFASLKANLEKRLYCSQSSDVSSKDIEKNSKLYFDFIQDIKVLYPETWPNTSDVTEVDSPAPLPITYGADSIQRLAEKFNLNV